MKPRILKALFVLLMSGTVSLLFAWGVWGHKHISRAAVFALPESMQPFYYNHIDFITEGGVIPDLRRAMINDKNEAPRHYIDIEDFGSILLDSFPKSHPRRAELVATAEKSTRKARKTAKKASAKSAKESNG